MKSARGKVFEDGLEILFYLMYAKGNSHSLRSFTFTGFHPKKIKRIMDALERCKKAKVTSSIINGEIRWRCILLTETSDYPTLKACCSCTLVSKKPGKDFHKCRRFKDGLQPRCKRCQIRRNQIYLENNRDKINKIRRREYAKRRKLQTIRTI